MLQSRAVSLLTWMTLDSDVSHLKETQPEDVITIDLKPVRVNFITGDDLSVVTVSSLLNAGFSVVGGDYYAATQAKDRSASIAMIIRVPRALMEESRETVKALLKTNMVLVPTEKKNG